MLKGLIHAAQSVVRRAGNPGRARAYEQQSSRFIHRTPSGLSFELYPNEYVDRVIAVEGIFERRFLEYIRSILKHDAVMLDIGANIGNHSVYLAKYCREVHCFEPNPTVADRLARNISLNGLNNKIHLHQFGLGAKDEALPFVENAEGNLGASHFAAPDSPIPDGVKYLQVKEASGAVAALNLDRIDYIKIDVEGMEETVLTALRPVIKKYRPMVTFEHHEQLVAEGTFERISAAFDEYKLIYPFFAPDGNGAQKLLWNLRHNGGPVLTEITKPERRSYDNILAIPLSATS